MFFEKEEKKFIGMQTNVELIKGKNGLIYRYTFDPIDGIKFTMDYVSKYRVYLDLYFKEKIFIKEKWTFTNKKYEKLLKKKISEDEAYQIYKKENTKRALIDLYQLAYDNTIFNFKNLKVKTYRSNDWENIKVRFFTFHFKDAEDIEFEIVFHEKKLKYVRLKNNKYDLSGSCPTFFDLQKLEDYFVRTSTQRLKFII